MRLNDNNYRKLHLPQRGVISMLRMILTFGVILLILISSVLDDK